MTTRDEYWTRDEAANEADRRAEACWWCRRGEHALCEHAGCACECDEHA